MGLKKYFSYGVLTLFTFTLLVAAEADYSTIAVQCFSDGEKNGLPIVLTKEQVTFFDYFNGIQEVDQATIDEVNPEFFEKSKEGAFVINFNNPEITCSLDNFSALLEFAEANKEEFSEVQYTATIHKEGGLSAHDLEQLLKTAVRLCLKEAVLKKLIKTLALQFNDTECMSDFLAGNPALAHCLDQLDVVSPKHSLLAYQTTQQAQRVAGDARNILYSSDRRYRAERINDEKNKVYFLKVSTTEDGRLVGIMPFTNSIFSMIFSCDSKLLATITDTGKIVVLGIPTMSIFREANVSRPYVLHFSSQNTYLLAHSKMLDLRNVIIDQKTALVFPGGPQCYAFSPDDKYVALGYFNRTARLFNLSTTPNSPVDLPYLPSVDQLIFSSDKKYLVATSFYRFTKILDLTKNPIQMSGSIPYQEDIKNLLLSPDGNYCATSSANHFVRLIKPASAVVNGYYTIHFIFKHKYSINSSVFSPDSRYFATASSDKTAKVVNLATASLVSLNHSDEVTSIEFSSDSRLISTVSKYTVKIHDLISKPVTLIHTIEHPRGMYDYPVRFSFFTPDTNILLTASSGSEAYNTPLATDLSHQQRYLLETLATLKVPEKKIPEQAKELLATVPDRYKKHLADQGLCLIL